MTTPEKIREALTSVETEIEALIKVRDGLRDALAILDPDGPGDFETAVALHDGNLSAALRSMKSKPAGEGKKRSTSSRATSVPRPSPVSAQVARFNRGCSTSWPASGGKATRDELGRGLDIIRRDLSNALARLKAKGVVERTDDGYWRLLDSASQHEAAKPEDAPSVSATSPKPSPNLPQTLPASPSKPRKLNQNQKPAGAARWDDEKGCMIVDGVPPSAVKAADFHPRTDGLR